MVPYLECMRFDKVEIIYWSRIQYTQNNDIIYRNKIHSEEKINQLIDQLHNLEIVNDHMRIS